MRNDLIELRFTPEDGGHALPFETIAKVITPMGRHAEAVFWRLNGLLGVTRHGESAENETSARFILHAEPRRGSVVLWLSIEVSGQLPELASELETWAQHHDIRGFAVDVAQVGGFLATVLFGALGLYASRKHGWVQPLEPNDANDKVAATLSSAFTDQEDKLAAVFRAAQSTNCPKITIKLSDQPEIELTVDLTAQDNVDNIENSSKEPPSQENDGAISDQSTSLL